MSIGIFTFGATLLAGVMALFSSGPQNMTLAMPPLVATPFTDTACLECHTDRTRLTELAPVEATADEAESLSSGPG